METVKLSSAARFIVGDSDTEWYREIDRWGQ